MQNKLNNFEQTVLVHLPAAYNLARWLAHNDQDAEDLVQEAYLRAFKFFEGFHGQDSRNWLLKIVRNTFYSRLPQLRKQALASSFDEAFEIESSEEYNPEAIILRYVDQQLLKQALLELPLEYREVIVLRELEDLSYKEIAELVGVPIGTIMSRLARGRKRLQQQLANE